MTPNVFGVSISNVGSRESHDKWFRGLCDGSEETKNMAWDAGSWEGADRFGWELCWGLSARERREGEMSGRLVWNYCEGDSEGYVREELAQVEPAG